MASQKAARKVLQQVRPILSVDHSEARKRVFNLYKAWYRQVPYIGMYRIYLNIKYLNNHNQHIKSSLNIVRSNKPEMICLPLPTSLVCLSVSFIN
jgi:hypothetical protein